MPDEPIVETQEQEEIENELDAVISIPPKDEVLELLVTVSECGLSLPVTLFVKGVVITGNIISFETYMNRTADSIRNSINSSEMDEESFKEVMEKIAGGFDTIRTVFLQFDKESTERQMIHLDDVKILSQNGAFSNFSNALWRGALGSIDGCIIGSPSQTP